MANFKHRNVRTLHDPTSSCPNDNLCTVLTCQMNATIEKIMCRPPPPPHPQVSLRKPLRPLSPNLEPLNPHAPEGPAALNPNIKLFQGRLRQMKTSFLTKARAQARMSITITPESFAECQAELGFRVMVWGRWCRACSSQFEVLASFKA